MSPRRKARAPRAGLPTRQADQLERADALGGELELPVAPAPSWVNIDVAVPAPPPVTPEEFQRRLLEEVWRASPGRERETGEALEAGDRVVVDVIGFCGDRVVPFSARTGVRMGLLPRPGGPIDELAAGLVGQRVGTTVVVPVTLGEELGIPALAGQPALYTLAIREAEAVQLPDDSQPDGFARTGLGANAAEVAERVVGLLEVERAAWTAAQVREKVFGALAERALVTIPSGAVDQAILGSWCRSERPSLLALGVTAELEQQSLESWLTHAPLRETVERGLKIRLALEAIGRSLGLSDEDPARLRERAAELVIRSACDEAALAA